MCVCVCVCEREREREGQRGRGRERERETDSVCVVHTYIHAWPVRKEDLISKYQKEFSAFVTAVDFDDIQQTG